MNRKARERFILNLLILLVFFVLGTAQASAPCIGLVCNGTPRYDVRQTATQRSVQNASVHQVLDAPSEFDGAAVHITGQVLSIEERLSRNGHFYRVFTLTDPNTGRKSSHSLKVFSFSWPTVNPGDTIVVEGTYRVDYWFGGWPFENFIDAETIRRGSSL